MSLPFLHFLFFPPRLGEWGVEKGVLRKGWGVEKGGVVTQELFVCVYPYVCFLIPNGEQWTLHSLI